MKTENENFTQAIQRLCLLEPVEGVINSGILISRENRNGRKRTSNEEEGLTGRVSLLLVFKYWL